MSVLTTISGIPLYSTKQEALAWAKDNNKEGFHTHMHSGQTGFMGGANHADVIGNVTTASLPTKPVPTPPVAPRIVTPPTPVARIVRPTITRSSGSSGGGGY